MQTQRRLAQNREAARKSRLRKKVKENASPCKCLLMKDIFILNDIMLIIFGFSFIGLCSAIRNKQIEADRTGAGA